MFRAFPPMKGFVRFDLAGHFIAGSESQSEPDAVIEEPRGLLSDPDGPVNLIATDSVPLVYGCPNRALCTHRSATSRRQSPLSIKIQGGGKWCIPGKVRDDQ